MKSKIMKLGIIKDLSQIVVYSRSILRMEQQKQRTQTSSPIQREKTFGWIRLIPHTLILLTLRIQVLENIILKRRKTILEARFFKKKLLRFHSWVVRKENAIRRIQISKMYQGQVAILTLTILNIHLLQNHYWSFQVIEHLQKHME